MWSLLVPGLLIILFFSTIICLAFKKKYLASLLFLLWILINNFTQTFALRLCESSINTIKSDSSHIRLLTYNLHRGGKYLVSHSEQPAIELIQSIDNMNVDVLVLCELDQYYNLQLINTLCSLFPYSSYPTINDHDLKIYSRYPIKNLKKIDAFDKNGNAVENSINWSMSLLVSGKQIHLEAVHLASNECYKVAREADINTISLKTKAVRYYYYAKNGYNRRFQEAETIKENLNSIEIPTIVIGDFNDIGGSEVIRTIMSEDLNDAWWEGGFFYGATFSDYGLNLRLDHILYTKKDFELAGVKVLSDWNYSDHYPLVADLKFVEK